MVLCCLPLATFAQNFHLSARVGVANYQGELQSKNLTFKQAKMLGSLGAQVDLSEHVTARTYFTLTGLQRYSMTRLGRRLSHAWLVKAQPRSISCSISCGIGCGVGCGRPSMLFLSSVDI